MSLLAMMVPILPGKKDVWLAGIEQMKSAEVKPSTDALREKAGVHERTFLQETPNGDFVILTYEGDNPVESYAKIMAGIQEDFAKFAMDVHGLDVNAPPPALPSLVYDSRS